MKKIFLFLLSTFIIASCTITEKVNFNSKNGGEIAYDIDATEFVSFMEMADSTGKGFNFGDSLAELGKATESLKKIKGISNLKFNTEATKMSLSFSFDDLDALNRAHKELGVQTENKAAQTQDKVTIKNKKEWIYHTWPLGDTKEDSMYTTMGMMLTYKLEATFPKKVSSTDSKTIGVNENKITWTSTAEDPGANYAFDGIKVGFK